jgi:hypothetical protein
LPPKLVVQRFGRTVAPRGRQVDLGMALTPGQVEKGGHQLPADTTSPPRTGQVKFMQLKLPLSAHMARPLPSRPSGHLGAVQCRETGRPAIA